MTVIAFVLGVVALVVGLAVSIALHELGHLAPAKAFGVKVGQYMIGFGPTLWSRRRGETEYGVKAIPLGGYISMAGMYPPASAVQTQTDAEGVAAPASGDTRRGRLFATLVQDARLANEETLVGTGARRAFYELPVYKRIIIMLGGPVMNLLFAIVLFAIVFSGIGVQSVSTTIGGVNECVLPAGSSQTECAPGDPTAPAAAAGIRPGDTLVAVDGVPVTSFEQASAIIQDNPDRTIPLVVERDGAEVALKITPMLAQREVLGDDGEVTVAEVGFVGMTAAYEYVREPIWEGPRAAMENVGAVAQIMVALPVKIYETAADLVAGSERDPNGPLSIVGAGRLAGEVAAVDAPVINRVSGVLGLLASLNIALFLFNLIPLLPLDGGHIVIALWDGLRRGWARLFRRPPPPPVDATRLVPVTFLVVIAIIVMGGILILADVFNPVQLFG